MRSFVIWKVDLVPYSVNRTIAAREQFFELIAPIAEMRRNVMYLRRIRSIRSARAIHAVCELAAVVMNQNAVCTDVIHVLAGNFEVVNNLLMVASLLGEDASDRTIGLS